MSGSRSQKLGFPVSCFFIWLLVLDVQADPSSVENRSGLEFAQVEYQQVVRERMLDGLVEAVNQATMTAQTAGQVSEIYFDVDDYVKKGEVLLRLRDKEQRARLDAAQADFTQAEAEFKRIQEVYAKKLIARSAVDKAEAQLKSAQANLDQAKENLQHTVVRAPYSGIVVKRHIEVGEAARPGTKLFTGLSLETLRVIVNLPQDLIRVVRQQQSARVLKFNDNLASINAATMTISPYADTDSHTFLVRVNLPAGDHGLYPGMAVKVAFVTEQVQRLVVPVSAVTHRSEVTAVYVMSSDQVLSMRQIRAGNRVNHDRIEVLAGLQENERVATDPLRAAVFLKEHNPDATMVEDKPVE